MKIKHITIFALALATAVGTTSCKKSMFEDINKNPNQALEAPLSTVVTSALTGSIIPFEGENARLSGIWSQTFTGSDRQYSAYDNYLVTSSDFHWEFFYYAAIQQSNVAIAQADLNGYYRGICQITKGNCFGTMAALWGDIPYTESNNLVDYPNPKFDAQSSVYASAQGLLDAGIASIADGGVDDAGVDFFYSGDGSLWTAAAHTMKARYYMHVGNYPMAQSEASIGIIDPANNMLIPHAGVYNSNMNVYASFGTQDRQGYMGAQGATLPAMLDSAGAKNNAKTNEAMRFADLYTGAGDPLSYDLNYTGSLFAPDASFPMVTASENHLILAEIASRQSDDVGALSFLNNVRGFLAAKYDSASYQEYLLTDFDVGGIADRGKGSISANLFNEIMLEKYASLCGQIEVYNDVRRTKNEIGLTPKGTATKLPQRFLIPQDELNGNPNASNAGLFEETEVNQ